MRHIMGVDIGGTFTDFSLIDDQGSITLWKEATTPADPGVAVQRGLEVLADAQGLGVDSFVGSLDLFVHGQTIATNTVIQRNGPKTALLCTEGFRDVLYFRDGFKPDRYNVSLPRSLAGSSLAGTRAEPGLQVLCGNILHAHMLVPVSYTHLTLPTKRIV